MYLSSSQTGRVIRYDPINRLQLGGWAATGANSILYHGGPYGLIRRNGTNYNTAMVSGIAEAPYGLAQFSNLSDDGATLFSFNSNSAISVGLLSGLTTATTLSSTLNAFSGTRLANGNIISFGASASGVFLTTFNSSGALIGNSAVPGAITRVANSSTVVALDSVGVTWARTVVRSSGTGTVHSLVSVPINPVTGVAIAAASSLSISGFSSSNNVAIVKGHMGFYLVGSDATTNTITRFLSYDSQSVPSLTDSWTENFDTRNSNSVFSAGMVLAPEPGTVLTLCAGIGVLIRRRRRRVPGA